MGQFLTVYGRDEQAATALFRQGISLFHTIAGLTPSSQISCGAMATARFPRLWADSSEVVRQPNGEAWICAAGTWFYRGTPADGCMGAVAAEMLGNDDAVRTAMRDVDGIFAIVAGDPIADRLTVVTDRVGTLHVYSVEIDSCVVISTSSLVLAALTKPKWDRAACREFLSMGTIFLPRHTLFEGIGKLPAASVFRYHRGRLSSEFRYWKLEEVMWDQAPVSGDEARFAGALVDTVQTIGRHYRRPLFDLTAGFDSRMLLGAVLASGNAFPTVVCGDRSTPDVRIAGQIANAFGLDHRHESPRIGHVETWWEKAKSALALCDGEYDVLLYAGILDFQARLAPHFDATINGSAGEMARGYYWWKLAPFTGRRNHFDEVGVAAKRMGPDIQVFGLMDQNGPVEHARHFAELIRMVNVGLEHMPNTAKMDGVTVSLWTHRWQGRIASATSRLWPCISPFMWRQPMELALSAAPETRARNRMARRVIESFDRRLAALPMEDGDPALPLRLATAHLFWPALVHFGEKAFQRLRRPAPQASPNPVKRLYGLEEVRALLDPKRMASKELYVENNLTRFLEAARGEAFADRLQFGRILTLELVAQTVRLGAAPVSCRLPEVEGVHVES